MVLSCLGKVFIKIYNGKLLTRILEVNNLYALFKIYYFLWVKICASYKPTLQPNVPQYRMIFTQNSYCESLKADLNGSSCNEINEIEYISRMD